VLIAAAVVCALAVVLALVALVNGRDRPPTGSASGSGSSLPASPDASTAAPTTGQRATVIGVADAVTLDVRLPDGRDVVRVRALGVQGPGPCYGGEATAFARRVLGGQAVDLVADGLALPETAPSTDRFDRRLQRVMLDGGRDYAVLAAEAGIARTYAAGADPREMPPVRDAEARARAAGRGVWGPPCGGRE
jgi:micrococcal nuclease